MDQARRGLRGKGTEMADQGDRHAACVDAWLDRVKALPAPMLFTAFQKAFDALWARSHRALGDVTLIAIVDRVLHAASDTFPSLGTLRSEPRRRLLRDFRARFGGLSRSIAIDAIRFILIEFLRVIGNLTAEILTPALHSELSQLARSEVPRTDGGQPKATPRSKRARTA